MASTKPAISTRSTRPWPTGERPRNIGSSVSKVHGVDRWSLRFARPRSDCRLSYIAASLTGHGAAPKSKASRAGRMALARRFALSRLCRQGRCVRQTGQVRRGCSPAFPRRYSAMAHKILDADEIKEALAKLPDWSVNGNDIEAKFAFQGFRDAISFIVQVAIEAEVMNHHPEFHNSWNIVSFSFCTHDVGNKITDDGSSPPPRWRLAR